MITKITIKHTIPSTKANGFSLVFNVLYTLEEIMDVLAVIASNAIKKATIRYIVYEV